MTTTIDAKPYSLGRRESRLSPVKKSVTDIVVIVIACLLFGFGIAIGGALLEAAAIAGGTVVISTAFVMAGLSEKTRAKVLAFFARKGFWVDLTVTLALTIGGFAHGATMGTMGIFLGLGVSLGFAIMRVMHRFKHPAEEIG